MLLREENVLRGDRLLWATIGLSGAASLLAGHAAAGSEAQVHISSTLVQVCSVTAPGPQTIDPASTGVQATGSVSYQCNFVGSPTLRLWSQNGGLLVSPAAPQNGAVAQSRAYNFTFDGVALGQLTSTAATAAPNVRATVASNTAQFAATSIQLSTAAVVAGGYSDILFVDITP
jgi:hypothetical protein